MGTGEPARANSIGLVTIFVAESSEVVMGVNLPMEAGAGFILSDEIGLHSR